MNQVHDEMKSQIQDLSELISAKQQTRLDSRYKRIEVLFWIFGGLVAFITLMDSETVKAFLSFILSMVMPTNE